MYNSQSVILLLNFPLYLFIFVCYFLANLCPLHNNVATLYCHLRVLIKIFHLFRTKLLKEINKIFMEDLLNVFKIIRMYNSQSMILLFDFPLCFFIIYLTFMHQSHTDCGYKFTHITI